MCLIGLFTKRVGIVLTSFLYNTICSILSPIRKCSKSATHFYANKMQIVSKRLFSERFGATQAYIMINSNIMQKNDQARRDKQGLLALVSYTVIVSHQYK